MDSLTVRMFRPGTDASPLLQLLQESEAFDRSGERWSSEKLALYLSAPEHNPETDRWVLEHPDDPTKHIGHAVLYLPGMADERRVADAHIVVHPAWRRQGLGTDLALHLQKRLREGQNIRALRGYLDPRQKGPENFLARWGLSFNPAGSYRRMVAHIADRALDAPLPQGFTLRSYRVVNNFATVVEAMNRSYAGLYGHRTTSEDAFAPLFATFDWDGFLLLFGPDGRVAGTVSAEVAPDLTEQNGPPTGRLGSPGIVPEYRTPDLYRALLVAGARYLMERNVIQAELETHGDDATTIAAYEDLGFALQAEAFAYTKDL